MASGSRSRICRRRDPAYNGNPERNTDEPPPLFAGGDAFRLWLVDAPLPVDSGAREIATSAPRDGQLLAAFDRVWETLRRLYYSTGPSAARWDELKSTYRPQAKAAADEAALESSIDAMVAEQPLIKPLVVVRSSDRCLRPPAGVACRRVGARARRQHCRCRHCCRVCPRSCRAGRIGDSVAMVWRCSISRAWLSRSPLTTRIKCRSAPPETIRC